MPAHGWNVNRGGHRVGLDFNRGLPAASAVGRIGFSKDGVVKSIGPVLNGGVGVGIAFGGRGGTRSSKEARRYFGSVAA